MMSKGAIISIVLIILAQTGAWFQQFAQSKFQWIRDYFWINILVVGSFVSWAFVVAAKYGIDQFGGAWAYRIIQFSIGVVTFTYLTHTFLNESISLKNAICIGLSIIIILIQALWK